LDRKSRRGRGTTEVREMGWAFQGVMGMEDSRVVGGGSICDIGERHGEGVLEVGFNQGILEATIEAVDVAHITSSTMENLEVVAKEFLGPSTNLVNGSIIFKYLFHGTAVAQPVKLGTPEKLPILADAPAAACGFADKRMKVTFALCAFTRSKADWPKTCATHGDIEMADTCSAENMKGSNRSW
jgi:hypothetical protein